MDIKAFFDQQTFTLTYVLSDPQSLDGVVIDPVLDYDPAGGTTATASAQLVLAYLTANHLTVRMILETHAHADHFSGAQAIKLVYPEAQLAISERIHHVQTAFKDVFDLPPAFKTDGSQFDRLLRDGESVRAGTLLFKVIPTPGHTPACSSYLFANAVFTGDALFMPDSGTGRCDFPGGSARALYESIPKRLYALPDEIRVYTGHDYQPGGRPLRYESTIGEERRANIHLSAETTEAAFVQLREGRDQTLDAPKLLYPSVQVNIDAGRMPGPAANGIRYLKIPLNAGATAKSRR
jgi:glyoxylase-like metal-dependent hydrolase (beta-lactamase superfamily II)